MPSDHETGWSPYLSGALSGLVIVFSVLLSGKFFGAFTTFVRTAGMLESLVALNGWEACLISSKSCRRLIGSG
jgi:hypothetical protein